MRTARSSPWRGRGSLTEAPLDRPPLVSLTEPPLDSDPPGQRTPGQRPPWPERPPWTESPQKEYGTRQLDRKWHHTDTQRPPVDRLTTVKTLPCSKLRLWAVVIPGLRRGPRPKKGQRTSEQTLRSFQWNDVRLDYHSWSKSSAQTITIYSQKPQHCAAIHWVPLTTSSVTASTRL